MVKELVELLESYKKKQKKWGAFIIKKKIRQKIINKIFLLKTRKRIRKLLNIRKKTEKLHKIRVPKLKFRKKFSYFIHISSVKTKKIAHRNKNYVIYKKRSYSSVNLNKILFTIRKHFKWARKKKVYKNIYKKKRKPLKIPYGLD